ncbi:MAG: diguanylate cyclase [Polyangia bacterium]
MAEGAAGTILVVDDDAEVRTFLRAILEGDGHAVLEARSGEEALAELGRERPQLVLLDVMLPSMDGFQVAEAIKQRPGSFVPVILLTALDDHASRARGIAAGADEVLGKPIQPFELRLRVRAMLRIQRLAQELHAANRRLKLLARTDELTRIPNRRGLRATLEREFHRAERYGSQLSLLAFDIDRFKRVNDRHGHAVGDQVLKAVARALKDGLRQVDLVARSGGEEFVVVAPETPSREAVGVAERLRAEVAAARVTLPSGESIAVTLSCGVATLGEVPASSVATLLAFADAALYRAKARGRDRCEVAGRRDLAFLDSSRPRDAGSRRVH